jgi:hypothetical protein
MATWRRAYIYQDDPTLIVTNRAIMAARTATPDPRALTGHGGCGTEAGWRAHFRRGEEPCQPCKEAGRIAQNERKRMRRVRRNGED